jgi:hypothetical protein
MTEDEIFNKMMKKAIKNSGPMTYKVVALGMDKNGTIINIQMNKPRFHRKGGGIHAEEAIMRSSGKNLKEILILRVGRSGIPRPIDPCKKCKKIADKLGVRIRKIK